MGWYTILDLSTVTGGGVIHRDGGVRDTPPVTEWTPQNVHRFIWIHTVKVCPSGSTFSLKAQVVT